MPANHVVETSSRSAFNIIDPDGDLVLVVGSEEMRLKVNSVVLRLASKVFRAMFSTTFKEGFELAGSDAPYVLTLPNDDGDAMTVICQLLHHRLASLPPAEHVELELLEQMVILADKYDCVVVLRGSQLVSSWLIGLNSTHDLTKTIRLAYVAQVLDSPSAFQKAARQIIMQWEESMDRMKHDYTFGPAFLLLADKKDTFNDIHARAKSVCYEAILDTLDTLLDTQWVASRWDKREKMVDPARLVSLQYIAKTHEYIEALKREDLWPLSKLRSHSLLEIIERMHSITDGNSGSPPGLGRCAHGKILGTCKVCIHTLAGLTKAIITRVEEAAWVCLDCIQGVGNETRCRHPHPRRE